MNITTNNQTVVAQEAMLDTIIQTKEEWNQKHFTPYYDFPFKLLCQPTNSQSHCH